MTRILFAIAALATFVATPAFAGLIDEVAQERNSQVRLVASPASMKGAGSIVTSEHDGLTRPATTGEIRFVTSAPAAEDLNQSGGR